MEKKKSIQRNVRTVNCCVIGLESYECVSYAKSQVIHVNIEQQWSQERSLWDARFHTFPS